MISVYNTLVDLVKSAKTDFVNTYAVNDEIKKPLQTFVDAQAHFAKAVAKESLNFWTTVGSAAWAFDAKKAMATK